MTSSLEPRASYRQVGAKTKVPSPLGLSSSKAVSLACCKSYCTLDFDCMLPGARC